MNQVMLRAYWQGSHWKRLSEAVDTALADATGVASAEAGAGHYRFSAGRP